MDRLCVRCLVSGHVQGVFFRVSTRDQAVPLGLSGHVRNRPDGQVEVVVSGEAAAVEALQAWLLQGPPHARVSAVECETYEETVADGFSII